jgi:hypothetical protein
MPFKIDMSDVGEGYEPIPAGVYPVVITSLKQSEEDGPSGYPYIIVEMTISDGEFENRKLWTNLSMSPKAAFKVKEFCLSVGVPEEELATEFEFEPDDYEGASLEVAVKQESYEGVMRNRITNFIVPEAKAKPSGPAKKGPKKTFR